jgi:hypothetical protein
MIFCIAHGFPGISASFLFLVVRRVNQKYGERRIFCFLSLAAFDDIKILVKKRLGKPVSLLYSPCKLKVFFEG